ncbi:hypothetical protein MIN45_P0344 [Methylomarinovum tepidoasis]|uniref:N-acetyltransferase domain-containing protein n=1 Tax=Methylomarinovum tepidoasis TaxID=2840183 RepID=A0AAU9C842_9GAMM|nr:GNAT family N-acetyltransferase [Methylomarinovum sp. IN45]BCX87977.1 hypothetical protein MIN45_P0344 [Methylomarinovum sp. IN45]
MRDDPSSRAIELSQFCLRPLTPEDEPKVLALWRAAFGSDADAEMLRWKFFGEFGHRAIVAEHVSGDLAAMFGGIPYVASISGSRHEVVHMVDNMSHPSYRGRIGGRRGVYVRTVEHFIHCFCGPGRAVFLYGFPGVRHFLLGRYMLQYNELNRPVCLEIDLREKPLLLKRPGVIRYMEQGDARLDRLAAEMDSILPFWMRRDRRFVQWRFLSHPKKNYHIWGAGRWWSRFISGYSVALDNGDEGVLVDLVLPSGVGEALSFISSLIQEWKFYGWSRVKTWVSSAGNCHTVLRWVGFKVIEDPLGIIPAGRCFDPSMKSVWMLNNLYYTMADSDLF